MILKSKYMINNDYYQANRKIKPQGIMLHSTAAPSVMAIDCGQYAFSNKFSCGECGRPVVRRKILYRGKNILHPAWHCRISMGVDKDFKDCGAKYILWHHI